MKSKRIINWKNGVFFLQFFVWVLWNIHVYWARTHLLRFPVIDVKNLCVRILFPLLCIMIELVVCARVKKDKQIWICVFGTIFFVIICFFGSIFVWGINSPEISKTQDPENYLVLDKDMETGQELYQIFPPQIPKDVVRCDYTYYRIRQRFLLGNNCYIGLKIKLDHALFLKELARLKSNTLLEQVDATWDGFDTNIWKGYTVFSASISKTSNGYIWVFVHAPSNEITYYYRESSTYPDDFIHDFLGVA